MQWFYNPLDALELCREEEKLSTALERNAKRARTVPEHIVREKALDIATAFELVSAVADVTDVVDND